MKAHKLLAFAMYFLFVLAVYSCENKNSKSDTTVKAEKVKAPKTDIHAATFMGNLKLVEQHIAAGTNLNSKEPIGGSTPLITACLFGKTEVAKALIDANADLSIKNNDGSTALHVAAFFCRTEIVKALLEKGADTNIKNNAGATALESVSAPFTQVKGVYEFFNKELGPLGLRLNFERIEKARPEVAELLNKQS
ncbi:ankyrin repeat domain-containing protein [Marinifilum caeruleilacunae]|uniref:Ankyrin repeat domain-containing protein n=1 Tax=Marinifilum caeruleilacunae TaxID=2499076 RepID=A0ABX1WVQ5_9BACT|nr:ankyrin repeat domain-containing protein [Marinifilum caeruleilacunae]NOU60142.1 ankyrin repeat domain-containing protein [Marinifilum caeruleilacunae]